MRQHRVLAGILLLSPVVSDISPGIMPVQSPLAAFFLFSSAFLLLVVLLLSWRQERRRKPKQIYEMIIGRDPD